MKGCLTDQSASNQILCSTSSSTTNTTSPLCTSCSTANDCNIETVRRDENCVICNSGLEPNCAQTPESLHVDHCSIPSEGQCVTRIVNGATVRGCKGILSATEAEQCRNNTAASQCAITAGQGSNNKIIPANRLKCFQCDSRVDATCVQEQGNTTQALPCRRFLQPENCLKLTMNDGSGELNLRFVASKFHSIVLKFLYSYSRMRGGFQCWHLPAGIVPKMRKHQGWM
jgi:hypothetical protein